MKSSADQLGPEDGNILEISLGIGLSMTRYFAFILNLFLFYPFLILQFFATIYFFIYLVLDI